jgi:hypothetical protein
MNVLNKKLRDKEIKDRMISEIPMIKSEMIRRGYKFHEHKHGIACFLKGIKVEYMHSRLKIKCGLCNSEKDLGNIENYLLEKLNTEIYRTKKGNLVELYQNPTVEQFFTVCDLIDNHSIKLEKPHGDSREKYIKDKDRLYIIYKITFINGKIYIGKDFSKNNINSGPFYMGSFNREFVYNDLIKTGWNGEDLPFVKREVLWQSNTDFDEERKTYFGYLEHEFIKKYKSNQIEIGYNQT